MTDTKRLNLSAIRLKGIAVIAMIIAHTGQLFLSYEQTVLSSINGFINNITSPIIFYFLVVGYHKSSNINRYIKRMGLFALVSYVPYILCRTGQFPNANNYLDLNVGFTLLLGLCLLHVRHTVKNNYTKYALTALLFLFSPLGDWGWKALLTIWVFDHFYDDYPNQAFVYIMMALSSGFLGMLFQPISLWGRAEEMGMVGQEFSMYPYLFRELGHFFAIWLLKFYDGSRGKNSAMAKWGFYILYPLHLLILGLIRYMQ